MHNAQLKPMLNASLPVAFRKIHIALAREPGHPEGESDVAYTVAAPLDTEGRIDAKAWRKHRDACRVTRFRPNEPDTHGHLVHRPGGEWAFHYDTANTPDEVGFHLADERFRVGEYVSINEGGKMHTYRVVSVSYV
jgi:hypothetical protein